MKFNKGDTVIPIWLGSKEAYRKVGYMVKHKDLVGIETTITEVNFTTGNYLLNGFWYPEEALTMKESITENPQLY